MASSRRAPQSFSQNFREAPRYFMPTHPAPTTCRAPGAHKRSVRNYLLDSRFQLKYTSYLVGVALVISGVMGSVLYTTTRDMVSESQQGRRGEPARSSRRARRSPRSAAVNITDLAPATARSCSPSSTRRREHDADDQQRSSSEPIAASLRQQQTMLVVAGRRPRAHGRAHRPARHLLHAQGGRAHLQDEAAAQAGGRTGAELPTTRLRKGDELQDFFDAFTQMVDSLPRDSTKSRASNSDRFGEGGGAPRTPRQPAASATRCTRSTCELTR